MQDLQDWALADLVAFVGVAEQGSFAAAARRVGRDPTVLSRRVDALERRLDARLLERSTRKVTITEAGHVFLDRARAILSALGDARDELATLASGEPSGTLRLSLPSTFGRMWITPGLPELLAKYPRLKLDCELTNRYVDLVGEGFDAAVRIGELASSSLVVKKLAERGRLFCASPAYIAKHGTPRHPDDLAAHETLAFTSAAGFPSWRLVSARGEKASIRLTSRYLADDAEALRDAALAGLGIMMATDWLVGRELAAGRLVRVLPQWTTADRAGIYSAIPSGRLVPRKTRVFLDWIAARFASPPWRIGRKKRRSRFGAGV